MTTTTARRWTTTVATMTTRRSLAALVLAALSVAGFALLRTDDDVRVDATRADARAAIEAARAVVPGQLVDVSRDRDGHHKWEVTLRANGTEYEVELLPGTLALLRIDYD